MEMIGNSEEDPDLLCVVSILEDLKNEDDSENRQKVIDTLIM